MIAIENQKTYLLTGISEIKGLMLPNRATGAVLANRGL
jgi:hypothetical protein